MNIKKLFGFGIIASFVSCQTLGQSAQYTQQSTLSTTQRIPVDLPVRVAGCVTDQQAVTATAGRVVAVDDRSGYQPVVTGSGAGVANAAESASVNVGVLGSSGDHVHTESNTADESGQSSTHRWIAPNGCPNETVESRDAEGNVHQIHRWTDERQKPHETDNWTDPSNNVHQCHRWVDDVQTTHEAVQVTKCDGSIVSEHFTKDVYGVIRRVDPVPLGQFGNSGDYRQNEAQTVSVFSLPSQASETGILSTANVVRAEGNLRADC